MSPAPLEMEPPPLTLDFFAGGFGPSSAAFRRPLLVVPLAVEFRLPRPRVAGRVCCCSLSSDIALAASLIPRVELAAME